MVQRVCLVSGGTGGHLMPALALARALHAAGHESLLVTEGRAVERELLRRELPDVTGVELPPAGRSRLGLPWWLLRATAAARRVLREQRIDRVVSTGGRPSVPVALAARSLGVPVYLLEQNAVTGRANRLLRPFAERIYHGLPSREPVSARALVTGTPLRPEIGAMSRERARELLGLHAATPVVLVTGGSQGARALNETVPQALLRLHQPLQVLHLAGLQADDVVRRFYAASAGRIVAVVRPVAHDMDRMFAAADLVICRGGGTTVAELCAVGRAAVIVPYPHHRDRQQLRNAEVLANAGAAVVVEEADLSVETLTGLVRCLLADPARLLAMGTSAKGCLPGDAAAAILRDMGLAAR
ncbi:MAG: UDP-N-acetylglucosamine--N-acetylmuramyl-(pentapeptide) pyrophosphoryl-undecaprenol N-acetylglucosamine transferase, partial [Planctomycetota bacterium]